MKSHQQSISSVINQFRSRTYQQRLIKIPLLALPLCPDCYFGAPEHLLNNVENVSVFNVRRKNLNFQAISLDRTRCQTIQRKNECRENLMKFLDTVKAEVIFEDGETSVDNEYDVEVQQYF